MVNYYGCNSWLYQLAKIVWISNHYERYIWLDRPFQWGATCWYRSQISVTLNGLSQMIFVMWVIWSMGWTVWFGPWGAGPQETWQDYGLRQHNMLRIPATWIEIHWRQRLAYNMDEKFPQLFHVFKLGAQFQPKAMDSWMLHPFFFAKATGVAKPGEER